jgi:hypothetical protein
MPEPEAVQIDLRTGSGITFGLFEVDLHTFSGMDGRCNRGCGEQREWQELSTIFRGPARAGAAAFEEAEKPSHREGLSVYCERRLGVTG